MATKIPAAQKRMFQDVFVCKKCNKKIRSQPVKIIARKVSCPKCKSRAFRPIRKK
ncbi:MAG: zinc ribbon-containing protein [Nanoarchaeota archaeon]|nr:zinc ribbon-containing protein [Nanoarchaeota archaeon]MBU1103673.1 zinc ribbon-containing protein [Nanoarchaeota archaeon]